jgi:hypothetical protein
LASPLGLSLPKILLGVEFKHLRANSKVFKVGLQNSPFVEQFLCSLLFSVFESTKELTVPKICTPDWSSPHLELHSSFKKANTLFG